MGPDCAVLIMLLVVSLLCAASWAATLGGFGGECNRQGVEETSALIPKTRLFLVYVALSAKKDDAFLNVFDKRVCFQSHVDAARLLIQERLMAPCLT